MLVHLRECRFTILMLAALVVAGVYGRTHVGPLDAQLHDQMGFSARHLWEGELHRLFTSLFFTAGGGRFYASLFMFTLSVGWVEWVHGTRCAALTFLGVHLITQLLLALAVAWPLVLLGYGHGRLLWEARDVGPSAGYYGCLGLAVASVSVGRPRVVASIIFGVLLLRAACSAACLPAQGQVLSADLAHLVAFSCGMLLTRLCPTSSISPSVGKEG